MNMQDAKEEVRSRLNIEDVIGEYVALKRAGRNFKGLSPFTAEKTPSFIVSPDKHIWHDFSSNKGGDVFSFVMAVEGMDFRESLEHLARKAGVDLSLYDSVSSRKNAALKKKLLEINELATKYYQQVLIKNAHAVEYVFKLRTIDKETVSNFRIGYAPTQGSALVEFLKKKGFSADDISKAGLANRFGGDLFRGRITVPLMDASGQIVGFTGRMIGDDPTGPKYLNTPQTLLYDKSRHIFALSQAKEAIRAAGYAVIVEGNLDAVSSHQAGIRQVVATAGTAMTVYHLKSIARLAGVIKLAFDGDKAGIAATERAIMIGQGIGIELEIITLPDAAKDPDELIKKDTSLWQRAIDTSEPAIDWVIAQYYKREDIHSAVGKRRFTTAALNLVKSLSDSVEREHYLEVIADKIQTSIEALREKLTKDPVEEARAKKPIKQSDEGAPSSDLYAYEDSLLAVMTLEVALRRQLTPEIIELFHTEERKLLAKFLAESPEIVESVPKELKNIEIYVNIILLRAETRYGEWSDKDRSLEAARLIHQIKIQQKKVHKEELLEQLRDAETLGDDSLAEDIRRQLNTLIKEM